MDRKKIVGFLRRPVPVLLVGILWVVLLVTSQVAFLFMTLLLGVDGIMWFVKRIRGKGKYEDTKKAILAITRKDVVGLVVVVLVLVMFQVVLWVKYRAVVL